MTTWRILGAVLVLSTMIVPATVAGAATDAERCRTAVDRAAGALIRKLLALEQSCLVKRDRGAIPRETRCVGAANDVAVITDARTRLRASRLLAVVRERIRRGCTDAALALQPPEGIGFPLACPLRPGWTCPAPIPGGGLPASVVVDEAIACVLCAHTNAVHDVLGVLRPGEGPSCTPALTVTISVQAPTRLAGVQLAVTYPDTLDVPGSLGDQQVRNQVTFLVPGGLAAVGDLDLDDDGRDEHLRLTYVNLEEPLPGPFARVDFCAPTGSSTPTPADLTCEVLSASDGSYAVDGVTCHLDFGPSVN